MSEKIYILLPVHNRCTLTRRFIESLIRQVCTNYHLVLIDDGSSDGTEQMVRSYVTDLTVIKGKGNWWWAGALQQGYLWLKKQNISVDDVVLIMNDDTEFGPEYLTTGLEIIKDNPHTLIVSQCYDRKTGKLVDPGTYHLPCAKVDFDEINSVSTRGLFLRVTDMLTLGGFHPRLLPHYLSDMEYTYRAYKRGMKLLSDKRLRLNLDEDATGIHDFEYTTGSKLLFLKKYFSRKSSNSPIYWTTFYLIASPWKYKFRRVGYLWKSTLQFLWTLAKLPARDQTMNK